MKKLVLIDGNSLINRAYYAIPLLITKNGIPTNAVYGFLNMFFKMIKEEKPYYVGVAFDLKAPTFRHKMYPEYKGTRKPMPEELRSQISLLKEILQKMNIAIFEKEGYEADDIIGTLAKATDFETIIYTGDRDSFQLVDEQTSVYFTKRGISDIDIYNFSNFEEKTTIKPYQIIELKALMGDASDNIPGVLGIGEKGALDLIHRFQNVDNIYANIESLSGKLKEKIIVGKESCYFSKTLATIDIHAPINTDIEKLKLNLPFSIDVKNFFLELEFKGLTNKEEFFEVQNDNLVEEIKKCESLTINNVEEFKNIVFSNELCLILENEIISIYDVKNNREFNAKILVNLIDDGISYIDFFNTLKDIFRVDVKFIVFNKKETNKFIKQFINYRLNEKTEDISLMKYLVDFSGSEENLQDILSNYGYNSISSYSLYNIYLSLSEKIKIENVEKLYYKIELPLSDVLFEMEEEGFKVDLENLSETGKEFANEIKTLDSKIREIADEPQLNLNSPKQLGEVLFDKLKIGKGKKTKTGYSTSADVLEEFENIHEIIPLIIKYRQLSKLNSTYIDGFKPLIEKKSGLIHTVFNQTVTATGRLSSKEPNLQNIPVRDEIGKELRKFFVSKLDDGVLISADYSQIELRLLACFSKCEGLIDAFNNGADIHALTASKVFNVSLSDVTAEMRRNAKAVNFGVIYGISEFGLAKNLKISVKDAKEYINNYFAKYPEVKKYMENNVLFAKEHGYSITYLGRRRYIRELNSSNYNLRQFGERVAMNMPLQGSAADIIKIAMINVYKRLKKEGLQSKIILQVHDELIIDAPISEKEIARQILKEEMENVVDFPVKLTVDVGEGKTWFEAK